MQFSRSVGGPAGGLAGRRRRSAADPPHGVAGETTPPVEAREATDGPGGRPTESPAGTTESPAGANSGEDDARAGGRGTGSGGSGAFRVLVVGPSGTGGIRQYIDEHVDRLDVPTEVHDSGAPQGGSGVRWFLAAVLAGLAAMARFPLRDRPDIVHVHSSHRYSFYRASFYVLFAKYVWRTPVVLHVHGSSFDEFVATASPPVAALQRAVFAAADRVFVLSSYWREVLSSRTDPETVLVYPNAVDPDDFPVGSPDDVAHVVFVSNLIERKGVRQLVDAVESLSAGESEFRVSIAGDGPLADEVERLADRHDHVTYHGYVSEERKRELLAAGSIFVLPTYAEGLPIAMLEGMAAGNAVVTTAVGSIPEVIDEERGLLVDPGDETALEAALAALVADPERRRRMAAQNRRAVEREYAWDAMVADQMETYRSVLAERHGA